MKGKILLFDFDKTLTTDDTIVLFIKYFLKKKKLKYTSTIAFILKGGLKYLSSRDVKLLKNEVCRKFKYFSEDEFIEFVDYVYKNHMLKEGLDFLENEKRDLALLVSASPINYLKYFKKYLQFDEIIGTELDENFNVLENNKGVEKVRRIKSYLKDIDFEIDYDISMGFSDSYNADRPMLEMVKNRFLINSKKHIPEYNNLYWK